VRLLYHGQTDHSERKCLKDGQTRSFGRWSGIFQKAWKLVRLPPEMPRICFNNGVKNWVSGQVFCNFINKARENHFKKKK
jgi:hypothetical protein